MARKVKDSGSGGKKGKSKRPPPGPAMVKTPGKPGGPSHARKQGEGDSGGGSGKKAV
jgi:hypothetical protein